jgi:ABC-type polysaccharide/polyol phosphate transport system ATPase subunit
MAARLGFSAAMDINPDILLVDEILAVGDERFQQKCNGVFERFLKEKKTVILVSHDLSMVQHLAQRAILLSKGKIIFDGAPSEAIRLYRDGSYQAALQ